MTALGYETPTPIQTAAIPAILEGRDICASAETGTGKTAAFVLPILHVLAEGHRSPRSARSRPLRALIVVPTRELALQIGAAIEDLGSHLPHTPKTCVAIGGVSINPQMMALRGGADVVVATPGRLLDLAVQNAVDLATVEVLVLDEADRLLALGFADELARVLALVERPQSLLFSATFPPAVRDLAARLLDNPLRVDVVANAPLGDGESLIVQRAIEVDVSKRTLLLRHLLEVHAWSRVLVFVDSGFRADHVVDKLRRARTSAAALHGGLSQGARTQALEDFKAERTRVLVATDVASRGIHIAHLPAVVNYDLPRSADDYLHRVGRTGRAGETGAAVSFVSAGTEAHFRLIEKRHHLRIERERIAGC